MGGGSMRKKRFNSTGRCRLYQRAPFDQSASGEGFVEWKARRAVRKTVYMVRPKKGLTGFCGRCSEGSGKNLDFEISADHGFPCPPAVLRCREG